MSTIIRSYVNIACVAALFLSSHALPATIRGRILDNRSSGPVAGARIALVGTTIVKVSGSAGEFVLDEVPVGKSIVRAELEGSGRSEQAVMIDSAAQIIDMTILLNVGGHTLTPGCIPEFISYQAELSAYLARNATAIRFEISDFVAGDSSAPAEVILSVTNSTPYDVYLLKDRGRCKQMYVQKLLDTRSLLVPPRVPSVNSTSRGPCLHELSDVVRIPRNKTIGVDTVNLWTYDWKSVPPGEYQLQLVYAFPQSRASREDANLGFSSAIANEKGIGELYCMTLQGRFESNILPVHIK